MQCSNMYFADSSKNGRPKNRWKAVEKTCWQAVKKKN